MYLKHIYSFSQYYVVQPTDLIYISCPPTFDPFICDALLAISCGATIVLASDSLRLASNDLVNHLFSTKPHCIDYSNVTIMQITPSLFMLWSLSDICGKIFGPQTSLRCLIFGGEPFPPMSCISKWTLWTKESTTKLYNIYGCTEMSCWSTIYTLNLMDIFEHRQIPIGMPIDSVSNITINDVATNKVLEDNCVGQLCLHSEDRKCYSNGTQIRTVFTGDLVERIDNNIYYNSRLGAIVKRYGVKVNLERIETVCHNFEDVLNVKCVFNKSANELLLCVVVKTPNEQQRAETNLRLYLRKHLLSHEIPDVIFIVDQLPLSAHGKVSTVKLLEIYQQKTNEIILAPAEYFIEKLNESLQTEFSLNSFKELDNLFEKKRSKNNIFSSFKEIGGTSFVAMHLLVDLEKKFGQRFPKLMFLFLNDETSLREIIEYLCGITDLDLVTSAGKNHSQGNYRFFQQCISNFWFSSFLYTTNTQTHLKMEN